MKQRTKKILSALLAVMMSVSLMATTAMAASREELQAAKDAAQAELNNINSQIKANADRQEKAEELKAQYKQQEGLIKNQIAIITEQMSICKQQIAEKQGEIEQKQVEIDQKQAEYDARWAGFKERMSAMQRLDEGGSIAMIFSAKSLYELLTFSKALEQISSKDTEICQELEDERIALNQQKQELEAAKAELESYQAELESQSNELTGKQSELQASIQAQDATITAAEAEAEALEVAAAEARKQLDKAATELDAYLNEQVKQYGSAAITCSLNFGPALETYKYVSCEFGAGGHKGVDFASPGWTPIYAVADGIVTTVQNHWSYGNYVQIYHGKDDQGNTYSTLYAHMIQWPSVSAGQTVSKGTVIGYVGSTGNSTGNHLHLEMKINGSRVNPRLYIPH